MKACSVFFALTFSVFHQANAANISCTETDKKGIEKSINVYLDDGKNSAIFYKDVILLPKGCVNGYAKVLVHPKKPVTDDAIVYLQQVNGNWHVLNLGTFFEPDFLAKIPQELH